MKPKIVGVSMKWLGVFLIPVCLQGAYAQGTSTQRNNALGVEQAVGLEYQGSKQSASIPVAAPARVRIGIKMSDFKKVRQIQGGKGKTQYLVNRTVNHTLRARIDTMNHFFFEDFHVETKPIKWIRKIMEYSVKIRVYQRYGSFGQLEEKLGSLALTGKLTEQDPGIFVLEGVKAKRFRNKFAHPVLDLVVGNPKGKIRPLLGVKQSKGRDGILLGKPYIRGRF
jgi:hypothetical protein